MSESELLKKHLQIKEFIKEHSSLSNEETNQILSSHFGKIPSLVKIMLQNFEFEKKKVLDIGCAFGDSLLYFGENSEGVEIQKNAVQFLTSLGKTIHCLNVEDGFDNLGKQSYEAIYCAAVIEHLVAPHLFLARLHSLLKPDGILAISYPIVPPNIFQYLWKLTVGYRGWLATEHINFFTPKTSKLIIERAGFKVIKQYAPAFYRIKPIRKINKIFAPISKSCLSVCKKITDFSYPEKRQAILDPIWASDLQHFRN